MIIIFSFWHMLAVTLGLFYKQIEHNFVYTDYFCINFKMECINEHFRHIWLLYFRKGKNAAHAAKKLRDLYGEEALKDRQCRNWFDKFRSGDFSLKDGQDSDRPNYVDDDQIRAIIESDLHVTVQKNKDLYFTQIMPKNQFYTPKTICKDVLYAYNEKNVY